MKQFVCVLALVMAFCAAASAQKAPSEVGTASVEDVRRLLDVTEASGQTARTLKVMRDQVRQLSIDSLHRDYPTLSEEQVNAAVEIAIRPLEKIWSEKFIAEMAEDMVPIYQKHYSKDEIIALTAFYSSPLGQKTLSEMPAIMSEFMQAISPRIQQLMDEAKRDTEAATKELLDKLKTEGDSKK